MTTDKKDSNVKPIFAGLKVDTGEVEVNEALIKSLENILDLAKKGDLVGGAYAFTGGKERLLMDMVGNFNPERVSHAMQMLANDIRDMYLYPAYLGIDPDGEYGD